jgi:hypothetical protein
VLPKVIVRNFDQAERPELAIGMRNQGFSVKQSRNARAISGRLAMLTAAIERLNFVLGRLQNYDRRQGHHQQKGDIILAKPTHIM